MPVLIGHIPFAIAYVLVGRGAGLAPAEIMLMSATVFAGASQMIVVTLMSEGVFLLGVLAATTLLVNLRHMLMGVSIAPHLERYSLGSQAIVAFFLIDESFALTMSEAETRSFRLQYFLTSGILFYGNWLLMTGVGLLVTGFIEDPMALPLDFVMPVTFIVLIVPFLQSWAGRVAALISGVTAVVAAGAVPGYWFVAIAAIVAAIVGSIAEMVIDGSDSFVAGDSERSSEEASF